MKLNTLFEDQTLTLYKGVSEWGKLNEWPTHTIGESGKTIPGFLSSFRIARVYSEPELTGPPESNGMIAQFKIDQKLIDDRTEEFIKWCKNNNNPHFDISMSYPKEWREDGSIWTVKNSGSGHAGVSCYGGASFVYCGVLIPYIVIAFYNNQDEWNIGK